MERPDRWETAVDQAVGMHANGRGNVYLARRPDGHSWQQYRVTSARQLAAAVQLWQAAGNTGLYISVNRFWGRRRIVNLAALSGIMVDVDYYKVPAYRDWSPAMALDKVLMMLEDESLPAPSVAICSQGLHLLWLHEEVPPEALPRWQAIERRLRETLKPMGAEPTNATTCVRLIGSMHPGGYHVEPILNHPYDVWDFETLAYEILKYDRNAEKRERKRLADSALIPKRASAVGRPENLREYTIRTLWHARLLDLKQLLWLRHWVPMPDMRARWLFLAAVAASWVSWPSELLYEVYELARYAGISGGYIRRATMSAYRTATAAARGEKVLYEGEWVDPRYRFKTATILEWLEITPEEQALLRVLIGPELRRKRDAERKERERRAAGVIPRAEYEGRAAERRQKAVEMKARGMKYAEIAEALGVSLDTVKGYFRKNARKPKQDKA